MSISALWLAPPALLYGIATRFRNFLYNIGYTRSFNYNIMVVAVGNLSVGGTGKSPMAEYLIRLLHSKYTLATLSRGYKRKTKGFLIADDYSTVDEIGDEPYQMYLKYKAVARIAVGEERSIAIPHILLEYPETQVVIMDDGYQHRAVRPDFSILLTDYNHLFYNDHLLPWGRLRESKSGAKRAQVVVVTKCNPGLSDAEQQEITQRIQRHSGDSTPVLFSKIVYGKLKSLQKSDQVPLKVVAFAGLADPSLFENHVANHYQLTEMFNFKDHHHYTEEDISKIVQRAKVEGASLLTTEKDVVKFRDKNKLMLFGDLTVYYLPIEHQFINNGNVFDELVRDAIVEKYSAEE